VTDNPVAGDLPVPDIVHYVGILEAVVAVLAIKAGLNPETMMGNAIESITEQANMETMDTERIIRERWTGRSIKAGSLVAQRLPESLEPNPVVSDLNTQAPATPDTMTERLRRYRERQAESAEPSPAPTEGKTVTSTNV